MIEFSMKPLRCGLEHGEGGHAIGRDPRQMTQDELKALGHAPMSPLAALRLRCLDCCAGSPHEVRLCVAVDCPSWPFRTGTNPWREKRQLSEEHRAKLLAGATRARNAADSTSDAFNQKGASAGTASPATGVPGDDEDEVS